MSPLPYLPHPSRPTSDQSLNPKYHLDLSPFCPPWSKPLSFLLLLAAASLLCTSSLLPHKPSPQFPKSRSYHVTSWLETLQVPATPRVQCTVYRLPLLWSQLPSHPALTTLLLERPQPHTPLCLWALPPLLCLLRAHSVACPSVSRHCLPLALWTLGPSYCLLYLVILQHLRFRGQQSLEPPEGRSAVPCTFPSPAPRAT